MAAHEPKTQYQQLLERCSGTGPASKSAEEDLDRLLSGQATDAATPAPNAQPAGSGSPLDALRERFRAALIPVFEEVKAKYEPTGILMSLDASSLFSGGRAVIIEFRLPPVSIRLNGTATSDAISFNEVQSYDEVPAVISSGARLLTRLLTPERFREFLCSHLAPLVRAKLRQR